MAAREYTLLQLFDLPEKVHYRALLDLAELAKIGRASCRERV